MRDETEDRVLDALILGGGQAGTSVAYFLKRTDLDFLILDDKEKAGGAWLHTWDSLRLFSPSKYSSLSGWQMPFSSEEYPSKQDFLDYLSQYQKRYNFPVLRDTIVSEVYKKNEIFHIHTNKGVFRSKSVISATGTAQSPFIPQYKNDFLYNGIQIHSVDYVNNERLRNKRVLVVGGGNSGAQILAEVSKVASTKWVTLDPPVFLPKHIDGRYLFLKANDLYIGKKTSPEDKDISLSNIVQVQSVREGLQREVFQDFRPFKEFFQSGVIWEDGSKEEFDAILWCTGFKANLEHLKTLNIIENNKILTDHTRSLLSPGLWLVGYGNWTGYASATIYGVGKTAKRTAEEIKEYLNNK
jgi:cation diffusion facilitator CzcD-associated flavoprotein CzcO